MNDQIIAWIYAIIGCSLLGAHFGSWMVGVGAYCCIIAIANWTR